MANENIAHDLCPNPDLAGLRSVTYSKDPFYPRFWQGRMACQFSTRTPQGIFVCDMSDLFGIGIPENWTWQVIQLIKAYPQHRFYLLTKQPQNLTKFSPFPDNCFVGVTATNDEAYMAALKGLEEVQAKVKFLSFEPLLEEVINNSKHHGFCNLLSYYHINWVIIGAQTKPYKAPKIEWVREIVEAADKVGIPVFIKDNLAPYASNLALYPNMRVGDKGYDVVRQEMP